MTDRQPIETALKDGTILRLLGSTGGANPKTFEALGQYRDLGQHFLDLTHIRRPF